MQIKWCRISSTNSTLCKALSLQSCKDKAAKAEFKIHAKAEFKIQPVTLPTPSFTDLILFTTGTMRSQWADSERTLNVHWTYSERGIEHWGNWGKERIGGNRKKIQYLCFFCKSQSTAQIRCYLQLFGLCSMCVQCCVHCMFTVCSMSASTRNRKNLQETIHLCNPVRPNLSHALHTLTLRTDLAYSLHTYPFAQVREAWSRAVSGCVGCECGLRAENKKKCFSETVDGRNPAPALRDRT